MNNYLYEIQISITPFLPATFSCAIHMIAEYVVMEECKSLFVFVAMRKRALHMRVQSWYTDARINKEMNIDIVFFSFKQKYRVDENAEALGTGVPSNPSVQLQGRPAVHYFVYKCPFLINCSAILSFSLTKKKGKKVCFVLSAADIFSSARNKLTEPKMLEQPPPQKTPPQKNPVFTFWEMYCSLHSCEKLHKNTQRVDRGLGIVCFFCPPFSCTKAVFQLKIISPIPIHT